MISPAAIAALLGGDMENAVAALTPGGIEQQEARGQRDAIARCVLPTEVLGATREQMEGLGFVFGDPADELFVHVALPAGWQMVATDHSYWTNIVDDKGRKRGRMFYKAAFYDRQATLYFETRFGVDSYLRDEFEPNLRRVAITDCGREIKQVGTWIVTDYGAVDALTQAAKEWLDGNWPMWRDTMAYWD